MLYRLVRPLFFALEPEHAHRRAMQVLELAHRTGLIALVARGQPRSSPRTVMGLQFPSPVGLAAGLDKNGEHIDALSALGFGFLEVGTVTPRPQPGNPAPRMFRLAKASAIINRMGFNNEGVERLLNNIARARYSGVLGINIGKNFDTPLERAADDYVHCLRKVYAVAGYIAINISSPNTAHLRQLQQAGELGRLLETLTLERRKLTKEHGKHVPLAVKIAPDLAQHDIDDMAARFIEHGIDAVIATNTTLSREGVADLPDAAQAGGLSGAPLKARSTQVVRQLATALAGRLPIIAAGGILSAADAREKIAAGASLVQLYTGLIYEGPALIGKIAEALAHNEDNATRVRARQNG
jgi:dihydroorotate dehydrogenase